MHPLISFFIPFPPFSRHPPPTVQGELPDLPPEVEALGPYAGILCAQVLHFMKPSLIAPAFRAIFKVRPTTKDGGTTNRSNQ